MGAGLGLNKYGKGKGGGRRTPTYAFVDFPEQKTVIIMKGGAFRGDMGSYITTFSVPDESNMAETLRRWKREGVNVSCKLQELLDVDKTPLEQHNEALQKKLWRCAFHLYFPGGFGKPFTETRVTNILGFKYTKTAVKKYAAQNDWMVGE